MKRTLKLSMLAVAGLAMFSAHADDKAVVAPAAAPAPNAISAMTANISGLVQIDETSYVAGTGTTATQMAKNFRDGFELRNAKLKVHGKINENWSYVFGTQLYSAQENIGVDGHTSPATNNTSNTTSFMGSNNAVGVDKAFVSYTKGNFMLSFGKLYSIFGYENSLDKGQYNYLEASMGGQFFETDTNVGINARFSNDNVTIGASAYILPRWAGATTPASQFSNIGGSARVTAGPANKAFHVGASGLYESYTADYLYAIGNTNSYGMVTKDTNSNPANITATLSGGVVTAGTNVTFTETTGAGNQIILTGTGTGGGGAAITSLTVAGTTSQVVTASTNLTLTAAAPASTGVIVTPVVAMSQVATGWIMGTNYGLKGLQADQFSFNPGNNPNNFTLSNMWQISGEAAGVMGRVSGFSEIYYSTVTNTNTASFKTSDSFWAFTSELSFMLSGEAKNYDHSKAKITGVTPEGKMGAFEVMVRGSYLNLNSANVIANNNMSYSAGTSTVPAPWVAAGTTNIASALAGASWYSAYSITAGLGWYANEHVSLRGNLVYAVLPLAEATTLTGAGNAATAAVATSLMGFGVRAQVQW